MQTNLLPASAIANPNCIWIIAAEDGCIHGIFFELTKAGDGGIHGDPFKEVIAMCEYRANH